MMKPQTLLSSVLLASVGLAIALPRGHAATLIQQPTLTDIEFNKLITNKQFTEKFVAQSRIGNNATSGTQEIDLLDPANNLLPVGQLQKKWVSGKAYDFTLKYENSVVSYIVDGQTISSNKFAGAVTDIFFRTRAAANTKMLLSALKFTDATGNLILNDLLSSGTSTADIDYMQLSKIKGNFTLTGKSTMTWTGIPPANSHLAYQIKVGTTPKKGVPEPALAGALLALGCGSLVTHKRR